MQAVQCPHLKKKHRISSRSTSKRKMVGVPYQTEVIMDGNSHSEMQEEYIVSCLLPGEALKY